LSFHKCIHDLGGICWSRWSTTGTHNHNSALVPHPARVFETVRQQHLWSGFLPCFAKGYFRIIVWCHAGHRVVAPVAVNSPAAKTAAQESVKVTVGDTLYTDLKFFLYYLLDGIWFSGNHKKTRPWVVLVATVHESSRESVRSSLAATLTSRFLILVWDRDLGLQSFIPRSNN
jgi:hypothetical protein